MNVKFEYGIGDKVVIGSSGRNGEVVGLWIGQEGVNKANVRWYDDNGRECETWYIESGLSKAP